MQNAAVQHSYEFPSSTHVDIDQLKRAVVDETFDLLANKSDSDPTQNFKFNLVLFAEFYLAADTKVITDPPVKFHSENFLVAPGGDSDSLLEFLEQIFNNFILEIEQYVSNGSGYVLSRLLHLDVSTILTDSTRAGNYLELPAKFRPSKMGILNIKNSDNYCLLYALIAWSQSTRSPPVRHNHSHRVANYRTPSEMSRWNLEGDCFRYLKAFLEI